MTDDERTDPATQLADKERQLEAQLAELSAQPDDIGNISFGKRIGEGTSFAVERLASVSAHDRLTDMLAEVRRARTKLAEGSYGTCDTCGRDIGRDRLEARPWATSCLDHA